MQIHSVESLATDLERIGVTEGDVVLVRASAKRVGPVEGSPATVLIQALLRAVGSRGTLLGLSFTKSYLLPFRHKDKAFDTTTPPATGGLAKAMVAWPGAVRSAHPTNSFVGIGARARELLHDHDENRSSFFPMERVIALGGKMILVGCITESPGFSTVHLVQSHLGLANKSFIRFFTGACYRREGETRVFWRRDIPGCSRGFDKFYGAYVRAGKLRCGKVGDADALGINAADAYAIEYPIVKANPKAALCDEPDCEFCRGSLLYNVRDMPGYWIGHSLPLIKRALRSL